MKIKALLYCCKAKPYLEYKQIPRTLMEIDNSFEGYRCSWKRTEDDENFQLNGKIVAECDYEVEEITYAPNPSAFERANFSPKEWGYDYQEKYGGLSNEELLKHSCLTNKELSDYLNTPKNDKKTFCKDTFGYAIHIKNLHIFDSPKELDYYYSRPKKVNTFDWYRAKGYTYTNITLDKAPQNMMYCCTESGREYILISIRPQYLADILNGEKTIEVRRVVLKEMLENE